jgi:hypothetical protein
MAVATDTRAAQEAEDAPAAGAAGPASPRLAPGLKALLPGERSIAELAGADGAAFLLTDRRVVYFGSSEAETAYASVRLDDVSGVEVARRPRDRRPLLWAVLGVAGAFGVWQVSSNPAVGAAAGAVVAAVSAGLFADYWFRPGGLAISFRSAGGGVSGPVDGKSSGPAQAFAAQVEESRLSARGRSAGPAPDGPASSPPRPSYPAV